MFSDKIDIVAGCRLCGFILIYLRGFARGKDRWVARYGFGEHFKLRLAHAYENLSARINVTVGPILLSLSPISGRRWMSALTLVGMLMLLAILTEMLFGVSPLFVILGGVSMVIVKTWHAMVLLGVEV